MTLKNFEDNGMTVFSTTVSNDQVGEMMMKENSPTVHDEQM